MSAARIRFQDPPQASRRRGRTNHRPSASDLEIVAELRAKPGRWAIIATRGTSGSAAMYAYAINNGLRRAFRPAALFEAVERKVNDEFRVYARFIGGPEPESGPRYQNPQEELDALRKRITEIEASIRGRAESAGGES